VLHSITPNCCFLSGVILLFLSTCFSSALLACQLVQVRNAENKPCFLKVLKALSSSEPDLKGLVLVPVPRFQAAASHQKVRLNRIQVAFRFSISCSFGFFESPHSRVISKRSSELEVSFLLE
jgi:hypothetical protein